MAGEGEGLGKGLDQHGLGLMFVDREALTAPCCPAWGPGPPLLQAPVGGSGEQGVGHCAES